MTRYIRLREWGCNLDLFREPSEVTLNNSDGLIFDKFKFRTCSSGFIQTGSAVEGFENIVFLGDSIVENMYVHEHLRMCSVLEQKLRNDGHNINILNSGMSGASTLHLLNLFINKIIPIKPKVVILMSGVIDISAALLQENFWSKDIYVSPIVMHDAPGVPDVNYSKVPDFNFRYSLLEVFAQAALSFKIPVVFATFPHRHQKNDPYIIKKYKEIDMFVRQSEYSVPLLTECPN